MQTANIMVALGGDSGNTVPRYRVSAAEIAVLRAIHGSDSILDVEPTADVAISNRNELRRIREIYAQPRSNTAGVVEALYPGVAARVFENIADLELPPEAFKAKERERAQPASEPIERIDSPASFVPESDDSGIREMPASFE